MTRDRWRKWQTQNRTERMMPVDERYAVTEQKVYPVLPIIPFGDWENVQKM